MKHLKQAFTKCMAERQMAQVSIGAFLVTKVKYYVQYPQEVTGYVRRNTLFIKLSSRENKNKLFIERNKICAALNDELKLFGYGYVVKDVRFL